MKPLLPSLLAALAAVLTLFSSPAPAQAPAPAPAIPTPSVTRTLADDRFDAGGNLSIIAPVAGDLLAAGGNVKASATIGGDAVIAGGNVHVSGQLQQDLYLAGGRVTLDASVARNARIAGGNVELAADAHIAGNASIAGGDVRVLGAIDGYSQIGGGRVYLDGPLAGDVEVTGGRLELGPHAQIRGKLRYATREPLVQDKAAQVIGGIEQRDAQGLWKDARLAQKRAHARRGWAGWTWSIGLALLAALWVALLPVCADSVRESVRTRWPMALLVGFVLLVCMPIAALLVAVTVVGLPLALGALALYLLLLLAGYVAAGLSVGGWVLQRFAPSRAASRGARIAAAALGMLAISALARLPVLGGPLAFVALLLGLGAVGLAVAARRPADAAARSPQ